MTQKTSLETQTLRTWTVACDPDMIESLDYYTSLGLDQNRLINNCLRSYLKDLNGDDFDNKSTELDAETMKWIRGLNTPHGVTYGVAFVDGKLSQVKFARVGEKSKHWHNPITLIESLDLMLSMISSEQILETSFEYSEDAYVRWLKLMKLQLQTS